MILKRVLARLIHSRGVLANIFLGVQSAWADGSGPGTETGGTLTQPINWSISAQLPEPKPHSRPHGMRQ